MDTSSYVEKATSVTNRTLRLNVGDTPLYFNYLQAAAIVFLLFILVLTLARLRKMYVNWSIKGAGGMIAMGFALAIIVEGFLLLGGRTLFTEVIGWQNAPKPLSNALDAGRTKLVDVLGVTEEIPNLSAYELTPEEIVNLYQSLSPEDTKKVKNIVCSP